MNNVPLRRYALGLPYFQSWRTLSRCTYTCVQPWQNGKCVFHFWLIIVFQMDRAIWSNLTCRGNETLRRNKLRRLNFHLFLCSIAAGEIWRVTKWHITVDFVVFSLFLGQSSLINSTICSIWDAKCFRLLAFKQKFRVRNGFIKNCFFQGIRHCIMLR